MVLFKCSDLIWKVVILMRVVWTFNYEPLWHTLTCLLNTIISQNLGITRKLQMERQEYKSKVLLMSFNTLIIQSKSLTLSWVSTWPSPYPLWNHLSHSPICSLSSSHANLLSLSPKAKVLAVWSLKLLFFACNAYFIAFQMADCFPPSVLSSFDHLI